MVTVFDRTPPIVIVTGTAEPLAAACGVWTLTWYNPTKLGARPENVTFASDPPIRTVG